MWLKFRHRASRLVLVLINWLRFYGFVQNEPPPVVADLADDLAPNDPSAVWDFKSGILDRLDEYFTCMRQLRRCDADSYQLYSRIGLSVPNNWWKNMTPQRISGTRATFGGVLLHMPAESTCMPSFVYFSKVSTPAKVQWFAGDVYGVVAIFDERKRSAKGWHSSFAAPCEFHVGIDPQGRVHLLKQLVVNQSSIQTRRKGHRGSVKFTSRHWKVPSFLSYLKAVESGEWTPEQAAQSLFVNAFITAQECRSRLIVRVIKDGIAASFGIDVSSAKTFFKDRTLSALARDGKRKRIFHSVRAHPRKTLVHKDEVDSHYRGIRHFGWNGYNVSIVFPKNNYILDFNHAAAYADDLTVSERKIRVGQKQVGNMMADRLSA